MKTHARKWIEGLAKYGIGFGLLVYVISKYWEPKTDPKTNVVTPGIGELLQGPIDFEWLAIAALLMVAAAGLQIYRWYLLVRALDLPFSVRNAYRLSLVGIFYNTFIPGSVGGDLVKAYFIAHAHPERKARAVASVFADRALGLFGLILFVAVLGSIAWAAGDERIAANPVLQQIVELTVGAAGAGALGFLALGLVAHRRDKFAARLKGIPKLGNALAEMWFAVIEYRKRLKVVAIGVLLSAASHFGLVFAFHCSSRVFPPTEAAAAPASLSEHMVIAPIGFIAQAIPLTPGGVGVAELIFAWLYKLSGRDGGRGATARLSLRIAEWLIALTGYIVYLRMRSEVKELEHEVEEDEEKGEEPDAQPAPKSDPTPAPG